MNKYLFFFISLFFSFFITLYPIPASQDKNSVKQILVLHSMEANRPWQILFNKYLREEIDHQRIGPYVLNFENLDLIGFLIPNIKTA